MVPFCGSWCNTFRTKLSSTNQFSSLSLSLLLFDEVEPHEKDGEREREREVECDEFLDCVLEDMA